MISDQAALEIVIKLAKCDGTEDELGALMEELKAKVPFCREIIQEMFWSNNDLSPQEIYAKAKNNYKPIVLGPSYK